MNIYEKIVEIMNDVSYLQKDDTVGEGKNSYKAISIEKVTIAVRESMIKHKIVILPIKQERKESFMEYEKENNYKGTVEKKQRLMSEVDTTYMVINAEKPEEFIEVVSSGCGVDTQDKGIGKAMSYSYKNMLLRVFAIPTGEDTDKTHNDKLEEETTVTKKVKSEEKKPTTKKTTTTTTKKADNIETMIEELKKLPPETMQEILTKYKAEGFDTMTEGQVKIAYHKYIVAGGK